MVFLACGVQFIFSEGRNWFGVRPLDPVTFGAVALLMTLLALAAAWVPAIQAASVDPMKTLRME